MKHSARTIRLVFFAAIASLLSFSVILFLNIQKLIETYSAVAHSKEVASKVQSAYTAIKHAESCVWAYVSSGEYAFLREKRKIESKLPQEIKDLKETVKENPKQVYNMQQFEFLVAQRLQQLNTSLKLHEQGKTKKKRKESISLGLPGMQQLEVLAANIQREELNLLAQKEKAKSRYEWLIPGFLILLCIILLLLLIFIFNYLQNRLRSFSMGHYQMQEPGMQAPSLKEAFSYNNEEPKTSDEIVTKVGKERLGKLWTFTNTTTQKAGTSTQEKNTTTQAEKTDPQLDIVPPQEKVMIPQEDQIIAPAPMIITKEKHATAGEENIPLPEESTVLPEEPLAPQEKSSPPQEAVIFQPKQEVSSPGKEPDIEKSKILEQPKEDLVAYMPGYIQLKASKEMFAAVPLEDVLGQVMENLREIISEAGTIIETNDLPVVKCIPDQLQLLFQNLLGSGLGHHQNGKANKIVITGAAIHFTELPDMSEANYRYYHRIAVQDNGLGFSQEYVRKALEVFTQPHPDGTLTNTGDALAICKKVVANHDGLIYVENLPDAGTSFLIYLPHDK
jgi:hypothetical protein